MRLAAQAKMGYYPTPEDVAPIIARYLKRHRDGLIRILDPCAGMGTAVKYVGDILQAETMESRSILNEATRQRRFLPGVSSPIT